MDPKRILMVKSHSMGVGDVLRSSAAWRVLRDRWPSAQLHLLFLSRHAGYPTEGLIRDHPLLASAHFVTIRQGDPGQGGGARVPLRALRQEVRRIAAQVQPDLVIDFEASGLRTTLVSRWARSASGATRVGIAQFPGRGCFYEIAAPSVKAYMARHGLQAPMDYTDRDFVALAGLGLERAGTAIEMDCTGEGREAAQSLRARLPQGQRVIGLNIGCGTPDALPRRPALDLVVEACHSLCAQAPSTLVLVGASFEKEINQEFVRRFRARHGDEVSILDTAGTTSLSGLTGVIGLCDLFVSSDSGPYHMAVALRKPTVTLFTRPEPAAYHRVAWCRCLVEPTAQAVADAAQALLA